MFEVFICNTPFQLFYINLIIHHNKKKHNEYNYLIISTINYYSPSKIDNFIKLSKNPFFSLFQLTKIRYKIWKQCRYNKKKISITLPHIDGILCNYFFQSYFNNKSVTFNFYYEGLALFRKSGFKLKQSIKLNLIKSFFFLLNFFKPMEIFNLFPYCRLNKATAYSPVSSDFLVKHYHHVEIINLRYSNISQLGDKDFIIFLSPDDQFSDVEFILDHIYGSYNTNPSKILIRPHFETKINFENISDVDVSNTATVGEYLALQHRSAKFYLSAVSSLILNLNTLGFRKDQIFIRKSLQLENEDLEINLSNMFSKF